MNNKKNNQLKPEYKQGASKIYIDAPLLGGAFMAIISAIPIIGSLNIICCMWLIIGGAISYLLASKKQDYIPKNSDGIIYGALSGIAGWIISTIIRFLLIDFKIQSMAQIKEKFSQINTPEADRIFRLIDKYGLKKITLIFSFIFIIFYLIFPTLGGAITQAITQKKEKNKFDKIQNQDNS